MTSYRKMLLVLCGMIATALILQGAFEHSDHIKAEHIVRGYRPAGRASAGAQGAPLSSGPSLGERVELAAPGGVWSSEITHSCRGYVRVTYAAPVGVYVFDYDVPQHHIHPGNPAAEALLASFPVDPAHR